jgi:hypothetical protein
MNVKDGGIRIVPVILLEDNTKLVGFIIYSISPEKIDFGIIRSLASYEVLFFT